MSKNPAWNAYNETCRKANDTYEATVKPLRQRLSQEISITEKRFDDQIKPLELEKRTLTQKLRDDFSKEIATAENTRRETQVRAHGVLQAEIKAGKEKKSEEAQVPA